MAKTNVALTKTCASCGQQKPLSAFLQLSGAEGSTYSNVCATCRKANLDKPAPKDPDEVTTSTTGLRIDSKTKVEEAKNIREHKKQIEETNLKEAEKEEHIKLEQTQKVEHVAKEEKKHRKTFLEKSSFLDSNKAKNTVTRVFGGEEQRAKERQIDLTGPVLDTAIGKEKYKTAVFKQFTDWLGKPVIGKAPATKPGTLTEYAKNTWGPNSRKK